MRFCFRRIDALVITALAVQASSCGVVIRKPLAAERPTRVSVGVGSATLNPGQPPVEDLPADKLEISRAVTVYGRYTRRMMPPDRPLVMSGTLVGQFVRGGRLHGDGVATSCSLRWETIGPALTIEGLVKNPIWVSGDIGIAAVRASREGCGVSDSLSARSISPMFGFSMGFGLTSRVGWTFGGEWVRMPLNDLGIAPHSRWSGVGALSIVVAF